MMMFYSHRTGTVQMVRPERTQQDLNMVVCVSDQNNDQKRPFFVGDLVGTWSQEYIPSNRLTKNGRFPNFFPRLWVLSQNERVLCNEDGGMDPP